MSARKCADYRVGWVCALPRELAAARAMLDEVHPAPSDLPWNPKQDHNQYLFGQIGGHSIVMAVLPSGLYGNIDAALATKAMSNAFPELYFALLVGVGGGVPSKEHDIRLGDVVVSKPISGNSGVIQYDFGKTGPNGEVSATGVLNKPPRELLAALATMEMKALMMDSSFGEMVEEGLSKNPRMKAGFSHPGAASDVLYRADYDHVSEDSCGSCSKRMITVRSSRDSNEPVVHYGMIGSANQVMKDARTRDRLGKRHGILCFEMEAAGMMDIAPCLVVRGICDYADSHKNKHWQSYAAIIAAAYAKELLLSIGPQSAPKHMARRAVAMAPPSTPRKIPASPYSQEYGQKLLEAAQRGRVAVVKTFLEQGGDPNTADRNWNLTALHYLARKGHVGTTRLLLSAGADPNCPANFTGNTPLFEAAANGHAAVIRCLLSHGANIECRGRLNRTPLHEAAANRHLACVTLLIEKGADPDIIDRDGCTPLELACKEGDRAIVEYLDQF